MMRKKAPPSMSTLVRALACLDLGDQFAKAGDRNRALSYYGRALNDYLREGLPGMAAAVAQRMVERYPDVVRASMTLAVLSLAEGLRVLSAGTLKNTCSDFRDYVHAVREAGQEEIAIQELRRFAAATESVTVRERMAEFLVDLGDSEGAKAILDGAPLAPADAAADEVEADQNTRWVQILLGPTANV
jgi:hypothetical protein